MAQIAEQVAVIRISKVVRNNENTSLTLLDPDTVASIQEVVQQLINNESVVVEVELGE
jgi:FtsZ-interacting cell division protein YlmF